MSFFGSQSSVTQPMFGSNTSGSMFSSNSSLNPMMSNQSHNPMKDLEVLSPPDDSISCLAFSPPSLPNNYLMSGSWDNQIRCWEISANSQTNNWTTQPRAQQTHAGPVLDLAFSDVCQ